MKKMSFLASILLPMLLIVIVTMKVVYPSDADKIKFEGKIIGIIELPINIVKRIQTDRERLLKKFPDLESFYQKQKLVTSPDKKSGEVINPLEKVTVRIGDTTAVTNEDGVFYFVVDPVFFNKQSFEIEVLFGNRVIEKRTVGILTEQRIEDITIKRTLSDVFRKMRSGAKGEITAAASIPCLDNNGIWAWNFVYSDCYNSLFLGPPWYRWMCWVEAMDQIHDHHGNMWCNGTHNCSLWVHGWNWSKQNDGHRHNSFWWPTW